MREPEPSLETFVMLKPNGVRHAGNIIAAIHSRGRLEMLEAYLLNEPDPEILKEHYHEHAKRPFYDELIEWMAAGPIMPMIFGVINPDRSDDAVELMRSYVGPTDPAEGDPRYHLRPNYGPGDETPRGERLMRNVIHASDSPKSAVREIALWFPYRHSPRTQAGLVVPVR